MSDNEQFIIWTDLEAGLNASAMWEDSDLFSLQGDHFNIEAVCPDYRPESQCWATWRRDGRGVAIVSGYDPDEDLDNHWLCHCGNYITHGGRCSCGNEPPWGADDDYEDEWECPWDIDDDGRVQDWEDDEDSSVDFWLPGDILEAGGWE